MNTGVGLWPVGEVSKFANRVELASLAYRRVVCRCKYRFRRIWKRLTQIVDAVAQEEDTGTPVCDSACKLLFGSIKNDRRRTDTLQRHFANEQILRQSRIPRILRFVTFNFFYFAEISWDCFSNLAHSWNILTAILQQLGFNFSREMHRQLK